MCVCERRSCVFTRKASCSFVGRCCSRCVVTEQGVISASIDFNYKGENREELVLTYVAACAEAFYCNKNMEQTSLLSGRLMHTRSRNTNRDLALKPKVTGSLMEADGRSFPSNDLLRSEKLLSEAPDLSDRLRERRGKRFRE